MLDARGQRHHFPVDRLNLFIVFSDPSFFALPAMAKLMPIFRSLLAAALLVSAGSCVNPRAQANIVQALGDAATEISGLKNDIAQLQTDMDSLRVIVIRQDSLINRIAAVNNIPR
jgi:hypothetical protein